jgi:hypothetical protein
MMTSMKIVFVTASAFACAAMLSFVSTSAAQDRSAFSTDFSSQQQKKQTQERKASPPSAGAPRGAPTQMAPRTVAPKTAPKVMAPKTVAPKAVAPTKVAPAAPAPKTIAPKTIAPKTVAPKAVAPKVVQPKVAPKVVTPTGPKAGVVTAGKLRGAPLQTAGKTVIGGRNFSVWRRGHRVRYDGRWRTLAALSALGAIAIGAAYFYPYAYIDAPQPFCEGLTADGCQLMWEEVLTMEGDLVYQCVAYCPWQ